MNQLIKSINYKSGYERRRLIISILIFSVVYFYFYFFALIDFSKNACFVFRDERLCYDGVLRIFQSKSIKEFFENIIFGEDLRYGRLFYNINAALSYIPYLLFHEQGQIIATRLTQFLALFFAYYFLVNTFLENYWHKFFAFIILVLLPRTSYFIVEPKPEPLQLFFFSLFLFNGFKNNWTIKPYIIYLGICLCLKISFLPLVTFFVFLFLFLNRKELIISRKFSLIKFILLFLAFSSCFLIYYFNSAEKLFINVFGPNSPYFTKIGIRPLLYRILFFLKEFIIDNNFQEKIKYLLIFLFSLLLISFFAFRYFFSSFFKLIFYILIGIIICTPCLLFIPINFKYLFSFLFDTRLSLGMDNPLTDSTTWVKYTMDGLCGAPPILFGFVVILPILIVLFKLIKKSKSEMLFKIFLLFVIISLLIFPIFLNVQRFFYFYLHLGFVFLIIFYFKAIDLKWNKIVNYLLLLPIVIFTTYSCKFSIKDLQKYSERSKPTFEFVNLKKGYVKTISYLNNHKKSNYSVFWDARLFFPDHLNPNFSKVIFWERFNDRLTYIPEVYKIKKPDFIVLSRKNTYFHTLIYGNTIKSFNLDSIEINSNDFIKTNIVMDSAKYKLVDKGFFEYIVYSKIK